MKIGRNAPCICGSGKKYKRCCGIYPDSIEDPATPHGSVKTAGGACNFSCGKDCAEWCCGGATLVTIDEITECYEVFPITVGFRKYRPMNSGHRDFLECVGTPGGAEFIVGDFIAGNRHASRCLALGGDNLCGLHKEGKKPAQCRLVPFCALYPEDKQDIVFADQRKGKFLRCRGFMPDEATGCAVWKEGRFIDRSYRDAYFSYQRGLLRQGPVMRAILETLKAQESYEKFLRGDGILEVSIPVHLLFEVLETAGFAPEVSYLFLSAQDRLCRAELERKESNPVFEDYMGVLKKVAALYADFLKRHDQAGATAPGAKPQVPPE